MKRIIAIILSLIAVLSCMTACSKTGNSNENVDSTIEDQSNTDTTDISTNDVWGKKPYRLSYSRESDDVRTLGLDDSDHKEYKGEELIDNEYFNLSALFLSINDEGFYDLGLKLVSKTDKKVRLSLDQLVINGVTFNETFIIEADANSDEVEEMELYPLLLGDTKELRDEYQKAIGCITDIWVCMRVKLEDSDSEDAIRDNISFRVQPFGEENSTKYIMKKDRSHKEIYSDDNIVVYYIGEFEYDYGFEYNYPIYIERKSDECYDIDIKNVKYNNVEESDVEFVDFRNAESAILTLHTMNEDIGNITKIDFDLKLESLVGEYAGTKEIVIKVD